MARSPNCGRKPAAFEKLIDKEFESVNPDEWQGFSELCCRSISVPLTSTLVKTFLRAAPFYYEGVGSTTTGQALAAGRFNDRQSPNR
ncbi:MAG: hypothetical protein DME88_05545 [Verrucomicrobia bacterium]|nr:MAG: hypothetical protein DME88_05545 [Verrucomicrobiota bacterium]